MPKEKPAKRRKNEIVANAARGSLRSRADKFSRRYTEYLERYRAAKLKEGK